MVALHILHLVHLLLLLHFTNANVSPVQVHLSTEGDLSQMTATWITHEPYSTPSTISYVVFGAHPSSLDSKNDASTITKWTDQGPRKTVRYTHRVRMTDLIGGHTYYYQVGSDEGLSTVFNFTALNKDWKGVRAAVYGDLGVLNGVSLPKIIEDAQAGKFDIIFHIGDLAYDLDHEDGVLGDYFMESIEPIASSVPYMTIAGNHEEPQEFNHFINRYTNPANERHDNQFWSFDLGPVHFVGLSSEYYCYGMFEQANEMWNWLNADLAKTKQPWIIGFMHRPMYCSFDCDKNENIVTRSGAANLSAIEPLFGKYGVDLFFIGHQHYYERMFPIYRGLAFNTDNAVKTHNAMAPVHILTGSAGCHSHTWKFEVKPKPFSASIQDAFGYSVLEVIDSQTLRSSFVNAVTGETLDEWRLSKDAGYRPIRK